MIIHVYVVKLITYECVIKSLKCEICKFQKHVTHIGDVPCKNDICCKG